MHDIKEARKGELNGFYGKKHTLKARKKITKGLYSFWLDKNWKYEDQYGIERANEERLKRSNGVK